MILWLFKLGITMLIHNKDDFEFVTEFPYFLRHPVVCICTVLLALASWNSACYMKWMNWNVKYGSVPYSVLSLENEMKDKSRPAYRYASIYRSTLIWASVHVILWVCFTSVVSQWTLDFWEIFWISAWCTYSFTLTNF